MTTGLATFDTSVQKSNEWLNELSQHLQIDDKHKVYSGLRSTLHALRDHLPVDLSVSLAAQLPMLLRGLYYEGWRPSQVPSEDRSLEGFLAAIRRELNPQLQGLAADFARETFHVLEAHVTPGETTKIRHSLPEQIRQLWPGAN
jgi:uncharacterized protein (DUF2267 family)